MFSHYFVVCRIWALARYIVFKTLFVVESLLLLIFVVIRLLTVVIGLLDIRGVLEKAPSEVLRREG